MTGDELEKRNIDAMGQELGKQYSLLVHEVTVLNLFWNEFIELFGTNDKRIKRLNDAAPGFFQMVQEQQFEANMLHLARLTDTPNSGVGKENLTVFNLSNLVADQGLRDQLNKLIEDVMKKTEFCRSWRNRRFAHHDLLIATQDQRAAPLPTATKEKFADALQGLSDLLNTIEQFYFRGLCSFKDAVPHRGVGSLFHILGLGIRERERIQQKISNGDFEGLELPESV